MNSKLLLSFLFLDRKEIDPKSVDERIYARASLQNSPELMSKHSRSLCKCTGEGEMFFY